MRKEREIKIKMGHEIRQQTLDLKEGKGANAVKRQLIIDVLGWVLKLNDSKERKK